MVKLLRLSESNKTKKSDCLVRRTDTFFGDQDVGLSVVMCNSEHPSSINMGVEADDWELSDIINGRTGG